MRIAEVDCTRDQSVCERLGVKSYPTFKVVTGGSFYDYSGPRGEDDFAQYVTEGYKVIDPVLQLCCALLGAHVRSSGSLSKQARTRNASLDTMTSVRCSRPDS